MSKYTHNICPQCWNERNPTRQAAQIDGGAIDLCCFCGCSNIGGIYIRHDPDTLLCKGEHQEDS